ncbi:cytochrome c biogenesis protein CcsA [Aquisalimonas sp.]|uniref:cytochrome C assembly family protein n=1 Tax=Aquisalimonas sp. TaxID=1872621 RepID=UPI0025BB7031|nr:cytochrome c biogenesis protein CcsA [Aquisalimonas sp.]
MMDQIIPTLLSAALYLLAGAGFAWRHVSGPERVPWRHLLLAAGWLGVIVHAFALWQTMGAAHGLDLGFFNAASLVAALMVLIVLLGALRRPVENLMVFILPVAALLQITNQALGSDAATITRFPAGLEVHVISSVLAFSVLSIAVVQSLVLAWQDHRLRHRQPGGIVRALPPLREMEQLLFQILWLGFILLTLALASGAAYLQDIFSQHLVHKTAFSIAAWLLFATLLFGRWHYGWRGPTAIRWTLGGFATLLIAYFGTKFVLELILGRG